jgi:hypothetical protein
MAVEAGDVDAIPVTLQCFDVVGSAGLAFKPVLSPLSQRARISACFLGSRNIEVTRGDNPSAQQATNSRAHCNDHFGSAPERVQYVFAVFAHDSKACESMNANDTTKITFAHGKRKNVDFTLI